MKRKRKDTKKPNLVPYVLLVCLLSTHCFLNQLNTTGVVVLEWISIYSLNDYKKPKQMLWTIRNWFWSNWIWKKSTYTQHTRNVSLLVLSFENELWMRMNAETIGFQLIWTLIKNVLFSWNFFGYIWISIKWVWILFTATYCSITLTYSHTE